MSYDSAKHPASAEALTVSDVQSGVVFEIRTPEGTVEKKGKFLGATSYHEEHGWLPVEAEVPPDGEVKEINLYSAGISCSPQGEWSGSFTVRAALDQ